MKFCKGTFFRKCWYWFEDPRDMEGVSMVNFFSYNERSVPGFSIRKGETSVIDLSRSEEELWEGLRKRFTRKLVEEGRDSGIEIRRGNEFRDFNRLYRKFRKRKGISADRLDLFAEHGILFSAHFQDRIIAAHVFLSNGDVMRSWAAVSERLEEDAWKGRRLIGCANRMLVWEALRFAKESGHTRFDMGGLDPHPEATLNEFKESFGGNRVPQYFYFKVYSPVLRLWLKARNWIKV